MLLKQKEETGGIRLCYFEQNKKIHVLEENKQMNYLKRSFDVFLKVVLKMQLIWYILNRFPTCNYDSADSKTNDSVMIIDLSLFMKSYAIKENTFLEFAHSLWKT